MAGTSDTPATWGAQLARAERILAESGSLAPQQEAAELLGHLLGVPVPMLLARPLEPMRQTDVRTYAAWIARRAGGVPIPYITGHLEFMGLDITMGWDSPLPPPGAPRLVEAALQWARHRAPGNLSVADIGTGCGAVALALATLEPRFTRVYAVDASPETLALAQVNGARYLLNLVIGWIEGDELDVVPEPVDLIVCGQIVSLRGGTAEGEADGHISARSVRVLTQAPAKLRPGGALICAVADAQRLAVTELLTQGWPAAPVWADAPGSGLAVAVAELPRKTEGDADS